MRSGAGTLTDSSRSTAATPGSFAALSALPVGTDAVNYGFGEREIRTAPNPRTARALGGPGFVGYLKAV